MANWDSADLLARAKRMAQRPASDEQQADADWYAFLTEAEVHWKNVFASHFPHYFWSAPATMTTGDGGVTYTFAGGGTPIRVEVYASMTGRLLRPGAYWDHGADYVWEGSRIRMPGNSARQFANGPVARVITGSAGIDGSTQPTLVPDWARILLVPRAVALWADRGGLREPEPFYAIEDKLWYGDPARGDAGILGTLKTSNPFIGATAIGGRSLTTFEQLVNVGGYG